ncbi:MAG: gliding motility-associated C-terminal domain-containing protein [Bacteroidota bacterium]
MKKFLFLLLFFLSFSQIFSQNNVWIANSTSDATAESMDIVLDDAGNSYITGYISGDTEFQNIQIDITTGYSEVIVAKIDPQGNYLWTKRFGGNQADRGMKIALTNTNEIIITGTFYGNITFESIELTATNNSKDIFIAKLSNDGDIIWARKDGGNLGDNVYGLTVDSQNNIITTGQFEGIATYGTQTFTSQTNLITNEPSFDIFVAKYDNNGNPLWSKAAYAEFDDRGLAVTTDASNNVYVAGQFSDTINFFGHPINNQINNAGFVTKFDANGNFLWFDKLAAGQVLAYDIEIDNQQNVVVTGDFLGQLVVWANESFNIVTNPYSRKIFVLKLSPSGNYIWGKANGSENDVSSRALTIDAADNIYIGGYFRCNFDEYRDSTGTAHFQSAGFKDIFVSKFSSNGNLLWKRQAGGQREEICWGIDIKESDKPVITGSYGTNLYFPFEQNQNLNLTNLPNQNYFNNNDCDISNIINFISVLGDESINFFTAKMISTNSSLYNYYNHFTPQSQFYDSIPMNIFPDVDSIDYCPNQYANLKINTATCFGPLYEGQWNNGVLWYESVSYQSLDGLYIVNINRLDACYSFIDSIYIDYHERPALPILTDDHGVNTNTNNYQSLTRCFPDTLNFYFNNICANCTATINIEQINLYETLINNQNYQTQVSSNIYVNVINEFGCSNGDGFNYYLIYPQTYDSIIPYLVLNDTFDGNDSIMICKNQPVGILIADSLTNSNSSLISHTELVFSASAIISFNGVNFSGSTNGHYTSFQANQSGWYKVTQNLTLGYENLCALDTTIYKPFTDSFYVDVKENPSFEILGDELLCPDSYNFLYTTENISNLTWYGSSILWTSEDSDSIKVNESGYYSLSGVYNYSEISCPFNKSVLVLEKQPPLVFMDPIDGIICPQDSVLLTLDKEGLSYEWLGPEGFVISTNDSVYGYEQGFYACIFTDSAGCQLLTNQAEIREYITPFLEFSPTNIVCKDEPITLTAIHGGLAAVNWHAPINSNSDEITVNQAGTYVCDVTQCGVTVIDSVTLINGSFTLDIQPLSSNICFADSVHVQATPGLNFYEWSNGIYNQSDFYTNVAGFYSVFAVNNYGCTMQSDTIEITVIDGSSPPIIDDLVICTGSDATISHQSNFNIVWYSDPNTSQEIATGSTFTFQNLIEDTSIYVAYSNTLCPLSFAEVNVDVLQPLLQPIILGDTVVCTNENVLLSVNPLEHVSYTWTYNGNVISTTEQALIQNITFGADSVITLLAQDICTSNTNSVTLEINNNTPIVLNTFDDSLCPMEQLTISHTQNDNQFYFWINGSDTINSLNLSINYSDLETNNLSVFATNSDGCKSSSITIPLTLLPMFDLNIQASDIFCQNNEITLSADLSAGNLTWILPDNSQIQDVVVFLDSLTLSNNGIYIAQVTDVYGCFHDDSISISTFGLPQFNLGEDTILCLDFAFDLHIPNAEYSFIWNGNSTEINFTPNGLDPVFLTAIDSNGCQFTDSILVLLVDCSGHAANFCTPNGDGINDYFTVFNAEYMNGTLLRIFNRWGVLIHEQENYRNDLDASNLSEDVYFYEFFPTGLKGKKDIGFFHLIKD